jgi:hypothetical protein
MKKRKSDKDESMLWRQRLHQKQSGVNVPSVDVVVAKMAQAKKSHSASSSIACASHAPNTSLPRKGKKLGITPQQPLGADHTNVKSRHQQDRKAQKRKVACTTATVRISGLLGLKRNLNGQAVHKNLDAAPFQIFSSY